MFIIYLANFNKHSATQIVEGFLNRKFRGASSRVNNWIAVAGFCNFESPVCYLFRCNRKLWPNEATESNFEEPGFPVENSNSASPPTEFGRSKGEACPLAAVRSFFSFGL